MQTTEITTTPVEVRTDYLHWSPIIAGALVASAFFLVLITFGTSDLQSGRSEPNLTGRDQSRGYEIGGPGLLGTARRKSNRNCSGRG